MNNLNNYYIKCQNLTLNKELNLMKFQINFIILKHNNNLIMNLIFKKEFYQVKDHLEFYLNVLVNI